MHLPVGVSGEGGPVGVSGVITASACGRNGAADAGATFDEDASVRKKVCEQTTRQNAKPNAMHLLSRSSSLHARAFDGFFHRDARPCPSLPTAALRPRYIRSSVPPSALRLRYTHLRNVHRPFHS